GLRSREAHRHQRHCGGSREQPPGRVPHRGRQEIVPGSKGTSMKHSKYARLSLLRCVVVTLAALLSIAACTASKAPPESVGSSSSAIWTNGGFEVGAAGTPPAAP